MLKVWRWIFRLPPPEAVEVLRREGGFPRLLAVLLANRGLTDPSEAWAFLHPRLTDFADPFEIPDMVEAVKLLSQEIEAGRPIGLYGDYDADGLCGTALLHTFLREIGARTTVLFPHRERDGYGFHAHLLPFFREQGVRLVVTVDCGIAAAEAVAEARRLGLSVIVTDHHELPSRLPPAEAVVTGKRTPRGSPFYDLSGAGMALALVRALRKYLYERGFFNQRPIPNLRRYLDLAALATVADLVPLYGENRLIVFFGLQELSQTERPGLKALKEVAGLNGAVGPEEVSFRLAPRLNAAGRLGEATPAFELLVTEDPTRARELARELNRLNGERQRVEEEVLREARERLLALPEIPPAVVLSGDWPLGVLGLVAGKLAEELYRPVVLLTRKGEILKGSGRSIPEVDLYEAFCRAGKHLLSFGGHPAAGGVKLSPEKKKDFAQALGAAVREILAEKGLRLSDLSPWLELEATARVGELLEPDFLEAFERLGPFGPGNPEPVLALSNFEVRGARLLAEKHLRFTLWQEGAGLSAVGFNLGEKALSLVEEGGVWVAASPVFSEFQGRRYLELRIKDLKRR
ncbi:single-stranded-DNA-specific exonuclease RecJ [Thermosulfurimonas marina]|uniref:Single-stranded-DNA-specific exonuclease RecJ n=1 Tax=Thermosulfurimonas marina TaxID=2047767 RepID=A0A6H1WU51_9BACT|nr:single-stranded-DNA-specific exonuclease RecJ [Thermosulfurimonas marina]QJA06701.1 single-stranded-DNA-specific exonuclease RecJ [Thermosulfurimonas marina]